MVNSWKDGKVKVNRTYFQITEEVIAAVAEIPREGIKFFRDKKMSMNAVDNFVKNLKEEKRLVKSETFYEYNSIKKLWRYMLRALIEYVTLDLQFDRVRTHHFILLNHFQHGVKILFSFYLFTSLSKVLSCYKKKPSANPALHEGLLLLVYEHFKALSISTNPK